MVVLGYSIPALVVPEHPLASNNDPPALADTVWGSSRHGTGLAL